MSEYVTVEALPTDNPDVMEIVTNQTLSHDDDPEVYADAEEGDVGSTLAQTLFNGVDGILALTIDDDTLMVTRDPSVTWEALVDDIRDALRDFFL